MAMWWGAWLVLWSAAAMAQLPRSQLSLQREAARAWEPAAIDLRPGAPPAPQVRALRLRVYAAVDYRAQTFEWSSRFKRIVERVNRAAAAWPGVRFEVVDVRPWPRDSAGVPLAQLVDELAALDPARDVDCVIGLAAAVPTIPEAIHNIGMARQPGRHFVMRNLHDLAEYEAVRGAFDQMSSAERERLLALRKAHKEVVVFLHEWAHTLGVSHAEDLHRIMNPSYHHAQSQFSEAEARVVELALARPPVVVASLSVAPLPERGAPLPECAAPLPDGVGDVVRLANAGRLAQAWDAIRPLLAERPDDGKLHLLACRLAAAHPWPFDPRAIDRVCERAAALAPEDATPLIEWAHAAARAHVDEQADRLLMQAEARLALRGSAAQWKDVAGLRERLIEPTLALADARRAGDDVAAEVAPRARRLRQHWLLPANGAELGLPAEREGEYVRQVLTALSAVADGHLAVVAQLARQLGDDFPRLPAAPLLRCMVDTRRRALARADRECREALARQEGAVLTHTALKELAVRRGQRALAERHRLRAEELER